MVWNRHSGICEGIHHRSFRNILRIHTTERCVRLHVHIVHTDLCHIDRSRERYIGVDARSLPP